MSGAFAKLEAQVASLSAQLAKMVALQNGVDPSGYERMTRAAAVNSRTFRSAAASTGMFEVQQLRLNSATEEYTRLLQKQKLSFRDLAKQRKVAAAAYKEQLAMQNMVIRQNAGAMAHGRNVLDVIFPKEVHRDLDTLGNRIGWVREQAKSASTQMVNWGKNTQWAGRQLMVGFTMPVAAFGAATGVLAYQIDKQLTRIQKVYDTTADATSTSLNEMKRVEQELAQVRQDSLNTALTAAQRYGSAAADTLDVQAELAATGLAGRKLQESTTEVMRIATLGEMEYADALNATISLQSVFRMNTEELTNSFNYMNAVENATSLQLKDFAAAIPIAAAPIKQMGGDIYELGILLTAMRERGIEATQGANAIKSAMQRLYRPSKQIREEFTALTGGDITKIVDNAQNLTQVFQGINELTEGMSRQDQTKVFAGLFGSYQVTRMSALVKGVGELEQGIGQVSAAARLAEGDTSDWAKAADRETKRLAESVSGRFKIALETVKIQLAEMGEPFIAVATEIINIVSKIIEVFNGLPDWMKIGIGAATAFAAIAGPAVMLTGLFANLAGNTIKMGVALTGLFTKFELLDKESRAAKLAAELASQGFVTEATAVQKLTQELNRLTLAQAAANRSSREMRVNDLVASGMTRTQAYGQLASERRRQLKGQGLMTPAGVSTGFTPMSAAAVEKSSARTATNWKNVGMHVGTAATSLAMFTMMGDGAVADVAEIVFYASLLSPAFMGAAAGVKALAGANIGSKIASKWTTAATAFSAKMSAAEVATRSVGKHVESTKMSRLTNGAKTAALGFTRMIGPVGWISLAVVGMGYALYKVREHQEEMLKQQLDYTKALNSNKNLLSESLDIQIRKRKQLNSISATDMPGKVTTADLSERLLRTPEGRTLAESYSKADNISKSTIATKKYIDVLNAVGGSSVKARKYVEALFLAAGDGALEAQEKAKKLYQEIGHQADKNEMSELFSSLITSTIGDSEEQIKVQGKALGEEFASALAEGAQGEKRQEVMNNLAESISQSWDDVFNSLDAETIESLRKMGVQSGAELRKVMDENKRRVEKGMPLQFVDEKGRSTIAAVTRAITEAGGELESLSATEREIVKELARQLGIKKDITSLSELQATKEWQLQTATKETAEAQFKARAAVIAMENGARQMLGTATSTTKELQLQELNQWRVALGMRETGNLADGFGEATRDITGNLIEQGQQHDRNNDKLRTQARLQKLAASVTKEQINELAKTAMTDFQSGMAEATMSGFQNSMDNALEALEESQSRRREALERQQDAETKRLENRQEYRRKLIEDSFDSRIDKINETIKAEEKAEEIRKRIFEAEMERLDRLNESANRNIDFNVALNAGNFDEAAKIRNDMEAAATEWALSDASGQGTRRSERRRERLSERMDRIEERRDARLDAIDAVEEREKEALERSQERRKKSLDRELTMEKKAAEKRWETRQKYLEESLDDFTGYIATSERDLRRHIKIWENEHKGLSLYTQGRFKITSDNINKYIKTSVNNARRELVNGNEWEISGNKIARDMIHGAFGMTVQQFQKWLVTGKYPRGAKAPTAEDLRKEGMRNTARQQRMKFTDDAMGGIVRHEGGPVDGGINSRKGYRRNAPIHRNESLMLAEKGEYVVNRRSAARYSDVLDKINSGKNLDPGMGGAGTGIAGLMGAMMFAALRNTISTGITTGATSALAARSGAFSAARAGTYGTREFSAEQLANAEIIANVGRQMGMSARDIQIGIMTAITESGLVNVNYGDRDSLGLFQQRPSMGWGTPAQVTDPTYAATKFFKSLKEVGQRGDMMPWLAAQAVQRSFDATGSNYRQYWDEAQAIFANMGRNDLKVTPGSGGWHLPISGRTVGNTHAPRPGSDIATGRGTPVRAVYDGTVIASRDIFGPLATDSYRGDGPYGSYGRYIMMRHDLAGGPHYSLYAHLNDRMAQAGNRVKGGTIIGKSGNTGNSSGPHLHFEVGPGLSPNSAAYPGTFLARRGLPALKEGAFTLSDGMAMLHRGETVLTADLSKQLHEGIAQFANGGGTTYNLVVNANGVDATAEDIAKEAVKLIKRAESRKPKPRSRRV